MGGCDIVYSAIFDIFALWAIGLISPLDMTLNFQTCIIVLKT